MPVDDGEGTGENLRAVSPHRQSATTDFQRPVFCILGLPFDAVSERSAAAIVEHAAVDGRRCFLSTPNLNFAIGCRTDSRFRASVLRSDLSVVDGMPLVWIAKAFGLPLRERIAGSSLFEVLRHTASPPLKAYLFGGPDGVAERACAALNDDSPGTMRCVGFHSPGFDSVAQISSDEVIAAINASRADFLVVALGAKKGQEWILANLQRLDTPVISHLGAVVNFVAGTVIRAPQRWQRWGLEWFWRIRQEPQLWRRYATDGISLVRLLVTRIVPGMVMARIRRPDACALRRATVTSGIVGNTCLVAMSGAWGADNLQALRDAFASNARTPAEIVVDLEAVLWMDSACIGLLLLLRGHQDRDGRSLTLRQPSPAVRRTLRHHCAEFLLEP